MHSSLRFAFSLLWSVVILVSQERVRAQSVSLSSTAPYTQNFNTLAASDTARSVPAGWFFVESGTNANATYVAGTGSSNTGNTYSFGAAGSGERAFGGLRSGSLTPFFGAAFTNNTGSTITALTISYTGEQWRLGALNRADRLDFQYSLNATSLNNGTYTDVDTLDFSTPNTTGTVGFRNGNLAENQAAVSGTLTGLSIPNGATLWLRFTDFDVLGADDGLAVDDFSLTPVTDGDGGTTPVVRIEPLDAAAAEAGTDPGTFRITRTGSTTGPLAVNYTVGGTATNGTDFTPSLSGTATIPTGQTSVDVIITPVDDEAVEGTETLILTLVDGVNYDLGTASATVSLTDNDTETTLTRISQIQGSGTSATAGTFTIEGIVVGRFPNLSPAGFSIQEEDTDADDSALTSEGIFVSGLSTVSVGDRVRITGTVQENAAAPSFNQAVFTPSSVQIVSSGLQSLVTPTVLTLPVGTRGELERYEGMLVTFTQSLTVTETFNLGRFGEVVLANGRLFQPTNGIDPNDNPASGTTSSGSSNVAAVTAQQDLNDRSRIILDDGSAASNPSDVPYLNTTDADPTNNTLRIGSTITGLTGVVGFGFNEYRIQPTVPPSFTYAARPAVPAVGGNVKVASFNVLNYFNGDGQGGGFPTSRGADSPLEFGRQRAKIIEAIKQLNADVVGLIEIENDGDGPQSAIADLVNGLNAATAPGTYTFVPLATTTGSSGTDEIKVAFLYKPATIAPQGSATYFNDPAFATARPPLAQTFRVLSTGALFTPIINHFKSKGSSAGLPGDADQGDGQAASNATRKAQATALLSFIAQVQTNSGDRDVLVLGDLNAYGEEDPIDILRAGGLTKLITATDSYVFGGQTGSLDHALATSSLLAQVTGAAKWNINADEPTAMDYNDTVRSSGESVNDLRNDVSLYEPTPFRSSDHDPVLVGLSLAKPITSFSASSHPASVCPGGNAQLTATVTGGTAPYRYRWTAPAGVTVLPAQTASTSDTSQTVTASALPAGIYRFQVVVTDQFDQSEAAEVTVTVEDTVAPTAQAQDLTLTLNQNGQASLTAAEVNDGSTDNCTQASLLGLNLSRTEFGCADVGAPVGVTLTVTDASGNASQATAWVTVRSGLAAPTIRSVAQPGNAYPAGRTSIEVTQYSGSVVFEATGCTGAVIWNGPAGATTTANEIRIPTTQVGTFEYTGVCSAGGCTSPTTTITVTVQAGPLQFALPIYDCQTAQLTLLTTGGNGNPIEFHIPTLTNGWNPQASFTIEAKRRGKKLKLRARQRQRDGNGWDEVELEFLPTSCAPGSTRMSAGQVEAGSSLQIQVLGNPVEDQLQVEVRGARGEPLRLQLIDGRGRVMETRSVEQAGEVERHGFKVSQQSAGLLLLQAHTPTQRHQVKIIKQ